MALINPFPEKRIREFLASARDYQKFLFSLSSAQRAITLADAIVNGFAASDKQAIDSALDLCWSAASTSDFAPLANHASLLHDRLVPEDDDTYGFYNSATNDAITSLIYAIRCAVGDDSDSAYYAAETLFNLADLLLNRNRTEYVSDLASAPITAYAAKCISSDLVGQVGQDSSTNIDQIRTRLIEEGRELSTLAD
ncbi:hypothetical protein FR943_05375 [Mycobacterium sp. TNTM28]|uniref:DUF416 family protein n=1 Tax=[Mycobacterium] fortunisiensis TaxID=2600579 RepID=A0ABS6KI81_9MYCO|nr:DUF416 family protein [[Mycobacterium] fortunisiensis]MBU9763273.1 hypothetical protein [[Mycobacterium] fortunisiensis]